MLEGMKLSNIQALEEIKFTDTTRKGIRLGLIVVRLLDSYQRGKKKGIEERRARQYYSMYQYYSKTVTVF